jgi:hypothetical protein
VILRRIVAWTETEIESLRKAIASGVLTVSYDGPPRRQITYQSLKEMRDLLTEMTASASAAAGTGNPYRLAATRKGL